MQFAHFALVVVLIVSFKLTCHYIKQIKKCLNQNALICPQHFFLEKRRSEK